MPRPGIGRLLGGCGLHLRAITGQQVQVRRHPRQDPPHPGLIKSHVFRDVLSIGTEVDDHLFAAFQPFQPVETPAEDLDLLRHAGLHPGMRWRWCCVLLAGCGVVMGTELTEPRGDLAGLVVLEELMDTAPAQPGRGGNLSDRQPGLVGRHDGPDPFLLRLGQARGRQAQSGCELLCVSDTVSEGHTSFHGLENTGLSLLCPVNWTGSRTFLLQFFRKAMRRQLTRTLP